LPNDAVSLRAPVPLNDVEEDLFAAFEAFVAIFLNGTEMDEDIIAAIVPKEAVAFDVVKPFHGAFILAHRVHLFRGVVGYGVFDRLTLSAQDI
jgi:hypothetical protein